MLNGARTTHVATGSNVGGHRARADAKLPPSFGNMSKLEGNLHLSTISTFYNFL